MKKNLDIANRLCQSSGPSLNRASTVLTFELVKNKIYGVTVQMKVTQHFFLVGSTSLVVNFPPKQRILLSRTTAIKTNEQHFSLSLFVTLYER